MTQEPKVRELLKVYLRKTSFAELFPKHANKKGAKLVEANESDEDEWLECSTSAGELYYYNTKTNLSSWENPSKG